MHNLLTSGRYNEILDYSSIILSKNPLNIKALKYKAYALYFLGRYDEAISYYDKAIEVEPESPSTYAGKSRSLEKLGRLEEASDYYKKAKELGGKTDNLGHNKNEWGNTQENQKQKPTVFHSYKVKWETDD